MLFSQTYCKPSCWLALVVLLSSAAPSALSQQLYDQPAFDLIVLKAGSGGDKVRVRPLDFPNGRVPNPFPSGQLKFRLIDDPAAEREVNWTAIERIDLFPQVLMAEALKLTSEGKFDDAFDYFARLHSRYPDSEGLQQATSQYLQQDALATFKAGDYDRALAMLASLYQRQPGFAGLGKAVDKVADEIIQGHLRERDLRSARSVLDVVDAQFGNLDLTVIRRWRERFRKGADEQIEKGAQAFRQKQYRDARSAALQAQSIWPGHEQAAKLLELIQAANPTVIVGVREMAPRPLKSRVDSLASIRSGFVGAPTLSRISDYSAEGGIYASPIGVMGLDSTGREISLTVLDYPAGSPAALDAPAAVARWMLRAADPDDQLHQPGIANVLGGVLTPEPDLLIVELARAHVRPEALLQDVALKDCELPAPGGSFRALEVDADTLEFEAVGSDSAVSRIEERHIGSDEEALAALVRGDIDVLDRIPPWQVTPLRANRQIKVGQYRLPTIHVLIPTRRNPILDQREFRRALCYGINRNQVLTKLITGGKRMPGYQVVSGPFPAGISLTDPVRYGYSDAVKPRPYEPRLAALLSAVAWASVQKEEKGKDDPADAPFPKLRLAHSSDPVARVACQAIKQQLAPLGVPIELLELTPQQLIDPAGEFDLRYAELATWEPVVDAMRVLGPAGVAGRCTDPMFTALERLGEARNWNEAIARLHDVHELAAGDLPVIPLWQTANYYAYRNEIAGLPATTIHLYQSLADWRKVFKTAQR